MSIKPAVLAALNTTQEALTKNLVNDARHVFSVMLSLDLMHLPLDVDPVSDFKDCVSAIVSLAGTYNGMVAIHFPSSLGMKVAGILLEDDPYSVDQEVVDALGELANMVAGNFKQHLSVKGADVRLSTPAVVSGKNYMIRCAESGSINLLFDIDEEWMLVSALVELEALSDEWSAGRDEGFRARPFRGGSGQ